MMIMIMRMKFRLMLDLNFPSISILDTLTWDNFKSEYDDTPNHDDNDN